MSPLFCLLPIFFFTYLLWLGTFRRTSALSNYNQRPSCTLWHLYHAQCMSPTQYYERNMTNVPSSLSCSSLGVLALETCNRKCLPSFCYLFLFCDMMASCFEIQRWRGKKAYIFDVALQNFKGIRCFAVWPLSNEEGVCGGGLVG